MAIYCSNCGRPPADHTEPQCPPVNKEARPVAREDEAFFVLARYEPVYHGGYYKNKKPTGFKIRLLTTQRFSSYLEASNAAVHRARKHPDYPYLILRAISRVEREKVPPPIVVVDLKGATGAGRAKLTKFGDKVITRYLSRCGAIDALAWFIFCRDFDIPEGVTDFAGLPESVKSTQRARAESSMPSG